MKVEVLEEEKRRGGGGGGEGGGVGDKDLRGDGRRLKRWNVLTMVLLLLTR